MTERQGKILEFISKQQLVKVSIISDLMKVSQVTIRKDLDALENRGFIKRLHGFASLNKIDETAGRIALNYDIKKRIAQAAAETVEENETVMIASGSCCALLAEELADAKKDITIITNSVYIANFIRFANRTKIIVLGGCYQPESQVLVGPMTRRCGELFFFDKFFIGADGFLPDFGFTGKDHLGTQTIMDLTDFAQEVIILTDSEKFQRHGSLGMVQTNKVSKVYTDDRIHEDIEDLFLMNNISLFKVSGKTD